MDAEYLLLMEYYYSWAGLKQAEHEYSLTEQRLDWGTSNTVYKLPMLLKLEKLRHSCEFARLKMLEYIAEHQT